LAHFVPDIPPGLEPGLDERVFYDPRGLTFPSGTYVAVVEVDPATGDIVIDRFLAVDDCGPLINPLLARGQVHGGIAQGLGQALLEGARYDREGSPASRDWTTDAFPRAPGGPAPGARTHHPPLPVHGGGHKGDRRGRSYGGTTAHRQRGSRRPGPAGRDTPGHAAASRTGPSRDPPGRHRRHRSG